MRHATAAHPMCVCREHIHDVDRCLGPEAVYRRSDGTEYVGDCRVLGGVPANVRAACPIHGGDATARREAVAAVERRTSRHRYVDTPGTTQGNSEAREGK